MGFLPLWEKECLLVMTYVKGNPPIGKKSNIFQKQYGRHSKVSKVRVPSDLPGSNSMSYILTGE